MLETRARGREIQLKFLNGLREINKGNAHKLLMLKHVKTSNNGHKLEKIKVLGGNGEEIVRKKVGEWK